MRLQQLLALLLALCAAACAPRCHALQRGGAAGDAVEGGLHAALLDITFADIATPAQLQQCVSVEAMDAVAVALAQAAGTGLDDAVFLKAAIRTTAYFQLVLTGPGAAAAAGEADASRVAIAERLAAAVHPVFGADEADVALSLQPGSGSGEALLLAKVTLTSQDPQSAAKMQQMVASVCTAGAFRAAVRSAGIELETVSVAGPVELKHQVEAHFVIWTPLKQDAEYYSTVALELVRSGGLNARLYHDLGLNVTAMVQSDIDDEDSQRRSLRVVSQKCVPLNASDIGMMSADADLDPLCAPPPPPPGGTQGDVLQYTVTLAGDASIASGFTLSAANVLGSRIASQLGLNPQKSSVAAVKYTFSHSATIEAPVGVALSQAAVANALGTYLGSGGEPITLSITPAGAAGRRLLDVPAVAMPATTSAAPASGAGGLGSYGNPSLSQGANNYLVSYTVTTPLSSRAGVISSLMAPTPANQVVLGAALRRSNINAAVVSLGSPTVSMELQMVVSIANPARAAALTGAAVSAAVATVIQSNPVLAPLAAFSLAVKPGSVFLTGVALPLPVPPPTGSGPYVPEAPPPVLNIKIKRYTDNEARNLGIGLGVGLGSVCLLITLFGGFQLYKRNQQRAEWDKRPSVYQTVGGVDMEEGAAPESPGPASPRGDDSGGSLASPESSRQPMPKIRTAGLLDVLEKSGDATTVSRAASMRSNTGSRAGSLADEDEEYKKSKEELDAERFRRITEEPHVAEDEEGARRA